MSQSWCRLDVMGCLQPSVLLSACVATAQAQADHCCGPLLLLLLLLLLPLLL
jgi:hypothetical protein